MWMFLMDVLQFNQRKKGINTLLIKGMSKIFT